MDEELVKRMDDLLAVAEQQGINFFDLSSLLLKRYHAKHKVEDFSSGNFYRKAEKFFEKKKADFDETCFRGEELKRSIDFLVICYESMYERKGKETFVDRRNRERRELASILEIYFTEVEELENSLLGIIEEHCCSLYPNEFQKMERLPLSERKVAAEELLVNKIIDD